MTVVLGLDPSYTATGWALVDYDDPDLLHRAGTIRPHAYPDNGAGPALHEIATEVRQLAIDHQPIDIGIETPIVHKSAVAAVRLAQVSGAILSHFWGHTIDPEQVNNQARTTAARAWLEAQPADRRYDIVVASKARIGRGVTADKALTWQSACSRWGRSDLSVDEADAAWIAAVTIARLWDVIGEGGDAA